MTTIRRFFARTGVRVAAVIVVYLLLVVTTGPLRLVASMAVAMIAISWAIDSAASQRQIMALEGRLEQSRDDVRRALQRNMDGLDREGEMSSRLFRAVVALDEANELIERLGGARVRVEER